MSNIIVNEDECGQGDDGVRVKLEKVDSQWSAPLYVEEPTLLLDLENAVPISRKSFEEFYGLCNKGPSLKRLKIGRDVTEAEVEKFFGPCNGKHSYRYNYREDERITKEVERLWMICHQRTVVPSNRNINKAEARGFALWKREPSVPVNWCVFAEWSIRDRIRRLHREEAKKSLGLGVGVSEGGIGEHSGDRTIPCASQPGRKNLDGGVPLKGGAEIPIAPIKKEDIAPITKEDRGTSIDMISDMILEWSELLAVVEDELAASHVEMKSLSERKEQCGQEFLRCSAQLADRKQLLEGASTRLTEIEADLKEPQAGSGDTPEVSYEALPSAGPLLRIFNSHVDMVRIFTEMFQKVERDHALATDAKETTEMEWNVFARKNKVLARQAEEVRSQLRLLKLGYDLPALHPRPPRFVRSESDNCDDCCVIANNKNCCFPGCEEEMHPSWWALFGLPMPSSAEEESRLLDGNLAGEGEFSHLPQTSVTILILGLGSQLQ